MKSTFQLVVPLALLILASTFADLEDDGEDRRYEGPCRSGQMLTVGKLEEIKEQLREFIVDEKIAHAVRLSFHDCVGGVCDGCINFDNPPNFGPMLQTVRELNLIYDLLDYVKYLTRADFYALAGLVAVEQGIKNANVGCSGSDCLIYNPRTFYYCRQDCPTSPETSVIRSFPQGDLNHTNLLAFYENTFGLAPKHAVALMGAHTLGGASGASGFLGFFKENATEAAKLDNRYFQKLIDKSLEWIQVDKSPVTNFGVPRWQWEAFKDYKQVSFMLQADVALVKEVTTDYMGKSACAFKDCENSSTAFWVHRFARNGNRWLNYFGHAFQVMINHGNVKNLVLPTMTDRDERPE